MTRDELFALVESTGAYCHKRPDGSYFFQLYDHDIDRLAAALAREQEAQPTPMGLSTNADRHFYEEGFKAGQRAAQPAAQEPSRLTDAQIGDIVREASKGAATRRDGTTSTRIARAVEAAIASHPPSAQEPVAEVIVCPRMGGQTLKEIDGRWRFLAYGTKLYAATPVRQEPSTERAAPQGLTDAEIKQVSDAAFRVVQKMPDKEVNGDTWDRVFARAILAARATAGREADHG